MARNALDSGRALERFARMVAALGGPGDFCEKPHQYLRSAPVQLAVKAPRAGWVTGMATRSIGLELITLGGGRRVASDAIDHAVGMTNFVQTGQQVQAGDTLALVHAGDTAAAQACADALQQHIYIGDKPPIEASVAIERIVR